MLQILVLVGQVGMYFWQILNLTESSIEMQVDLFELVLNLQKKEKLIANRRIQCILLISTKRSIT